MGQLKALDLGLGDSRVGQPISSSSLAPPWSALHHCCSGQQGTSKLSCFHTLGAASSKSLPSGPALLCCPGKVEGPLSQNARAGKRQGHLTCSHRLSASSFDCHRWWGASGRKYSPWHLCHLTQMRVAGPADLHLCPLWLAHLHSYYRDLLFGQGTEPALPSAAPSER